MGQIIDLSKRQVARDPVAQKLVNFSTEIDQIVLRYLYLDDDTVAAKELAGVLAHRLGTLINMFERKEELCIVCEEIMRNQLL